jgi:AcrR family transcriptional regulator
MSSHTGSEQAQPRAEALHTGRPRCMKRHRTIQQAALELLEEVGFNSLTIEGVAARAGVGKTTIYRRYPNKASLVWASFLEAVEPEIPFPDTGSVKEDLRRQMRSLIRLFNGPRGRIVATLIGGGQTDGELIEAFRTQWLARRREVARKVIRRGVERGELPEDINADFLLDALYGPIYMRLLIGHAPLKQSLADKLVEVVLNGLKR